MHTPNLVISHFIYVYAQVNTTSNRRVITPRQNFSSVDDWEQFQDVIPNFDDTSLRSNSLLEHMNTTKDKSDYLWYTVRLVIRLHFSLKICQIYQSFLTIYYIFNYISLVVFIKFELIIKLFNFMTTGLNIIYLAASQHFLFSQWLMLPMLF